MSQRGFLSTSGVSAVPLGLLALLAGFCTVEGRARRADKAGEAIRSWSAIWNARAREEPGEQAAPSNVELCRSVPVAHRAYLLLVLSQNSRCEFCDLLYPQFVAAR